MDAQQPEVVGGSGLTRRFNLTRKQIIITLICVAVLGVALLIRSFAAESVVATLDAETMQLPNSSSKVVSASKVYTSGLQTFTLYKDSAASGSGTYNAGELGWKQSHNGATKIRGQVVLNSPVTSVTARVKALSKCSTRQPYITIIAVKSGSTTEQKIVKQRYITNLSWGDSKFDYSLPAGTYTIFVQGDNLIKTSSCRSSLFVDKLTFNGNTLAPSLSFSGTGTNADGNAVSGSSINVATGSPVALNWSSTNTTDCTANNGWAGTSPYVSTGTSVGKSGSKSTSALNSNTSYSIKCTGQGGATISATVNVTVTAATPPPDDGGGAGGGTPNTGMIVGLQTANAWGQSVATDTAKIVNYVRIEDGRSPTSISIWKNAGVKVDYSIAGSYTTGGVYGLIGSPKAKTQTVDGKTVVVETAFDATARLARAWADKQVQNYQNAGCDTNWCPMVEVLNEPAGTWFWGSNAFKDPNTGAYAAVVNATYDAFHAKYGSSAPKILATVDGSYNNGDPVQFGKGWWTAKIDNKVVSNHDKVDGIIVHPYGGKSSKSSSALGNRDLVNKAYDFTKASGDTKQVYVTEVGWPTATDEAATGDSLQWTEAEQANNLYNFINWARDSGRVDAVMYFQYRDYTTSDCKNYMWYGVTRHPTNCKGTNHPYNKIVAGSKKIGWDALGCAAKNKEWDTTALTCK